MNPKNNLQMFCITLNPKHYELIRNLSYVPVGLGEEKFDERWLQDKSGNNISNKNKFYGEYTFHYWIWKNYKKLNLNKWIGFCQYRKFWKLNELDKTDFSISELNKIVLKNIPEILEKYDVIVGNDLYVNKFHFSKFLKNNFTNMIVNPSLFFLKKKRNIKFHFDMMHGKDNLKKAINLLGNENKQPFEDYVNLNVSFSPHNMFICKSKEVLFSYYDSVFPWLERCEEIFGFEKSNTYGLKRMYGFLAERYMSYWFKKNTNYTSLPIHFKDISDFL